MKLIFTLKDGDYCANGDSWSNRLLCADGEGPRMLPVP